MTSITNLHRPPGSSGETEGAKPQRRVLSDLGPGAAGYSVDAPPEPLRRPQTGHPISDAVARNLTVLNQASQSMTKLLQRNRELEEHIVDLNAWMKDKLRDLEQALAAVQARAETAEETMRRDKKALGLIQEGIELAFGAGSAAHAAMMRFQVD